jgi:hypothetical protein
MAHRGERCPEFVRDGGHEVGLLPGQQQFAGGKPVDAVGRWPSGQEQTLTGVASDRVLTIEEPPKP